MKRPFLTQRQLYTIIKPGYMLDNYYPGFDVAVVVEPNKIAVFNREEWENQGGE